MAKTPIVDEKLLQDILKKSGSGSVKDLDDTAKVETPKQASFATADVDPVNEAEETNGKPAAAPFSRKQAKEEYARKFLGKQQLASRKNISISDDVFQKLTYIHACLMKRVTLTAFIGHIIEDHIDTYRSVIKDISKDTSNSINL